MNVTLRGCILQEIVDHATACLPLEACGFLSGHGTVADRFVAAPNTLQSTAAYRVDPAFLFGFFRRLREEGNQLVGIVHSHPRGPARPSERDLREAHYPDAAHLIVSLAGDRPEIRAFRIADGESVEIELHAIV